MEENAQFGDQKLIFALPHNEKRRGHMIKMER